ncbi:exosortase-associated protein EpsI, V-type [Sphingobium boeckii]|uniref:EpsI family protein n=1 Tax=Sphingobium boeckii TaxID=1082345 RepID=A0A7W9AJ85_9SPHN|nr:exosortase-associated protein EpsI, V-type [Sphingobium boeckii]MBB5686640.1 EpsI family protein [Sphingobium boeckii]
MAQDKDSPAAPWLGMSRRSVFLGGALLATSGLAALREPVRAVKPFSEKEFDALIPRVVGPWTAENSSDLILPPPDQLSQKLYEQLVTRVYLAESKPPVMFLAAYSSIQQNNVQVHRPEVCYPAAGFVITENEPFTLKIAPNIEIPSRFLVAKQSRRSEMMIYWTRVDNKYPLKWSDQRLAMAEANLKGYYPDGVLARVSMIGLDQTEAAETISDFARELEKSATPAGRKILFG